MNKKKSVEKVSSFEVQSSKMNLRDEMWELVLIEVGVGLGDTSTPLMTLFTKKINKLKTLKNQNFLLDYIAEECIERERRVNNGLSIMGCRENTEKKSFIWLNDYKK